MDDTTTVFGAEKTALVGWRGWTIVIAVLEMSQASAVATATSVER